MRSTSRARRLSLKMGRARVDALSRCWNNERMTGREPRDQRLTFKLTARERRELEELCTVTGLDMSEAMRAALRAAYRETMSKSSNG
jgi:hypothetical protein